MDIFTRSRRNPVLTPADSGWWKVYNPGAAIEDNGRVHLFPRVIARQEDWHSQIAHAVSQDGETFNWLPTLALSRSRPTERRGLEDPRITRIGNTYHMVFATYDGTQATLETATTDDLSAGWVRQGPAVPDFRFTAAGGVRVRWRNGLPVELSEPRDHDHWSKSGAIFPLPDGRYGLLFGEYKIWFASSLDGRRFEVLPNPFLEARKGTSLFDNTFVEMGPPPIMTEKGWLILYHGVDEKHRYSLGLMLLDRSDPTKIIFRSTQPVFAPKEPYETADNPIDVIGGGIEKLIKLNTAELKGIYAQANANNIMPRVVFCPAALVRDDRLWLYYGAGDTTVCAASVKLTDLLALVP